MDCEVCGEEATWKVTFLLPHTRTNPASRGYGKDDCSWCADDAAFVCEDCYAAQKHYGLAKERGMEWCSAFAKDRFPHMFKEPATI